MRILHLLADGLTYKEICYELSLHRSTVRTHLSNMYRKLGVHDRAHAVIKAHTEGWIELAWGDPSTNAEIRLAAALEDIIHARRPKTKNDLTPAQRSYLRAFDAWLRAEPGDRDRARRAMMDELPALLNHDGTRPHWKRRRSRPRYKPDGIARLLRVLEDDFEEPGH